MIIFLLSWNLSLAILLLVFSFVVDIYLYLWLFLSVSFVGFIIYICIIIIFRKERYTHIYKFIKNRCYDIFFQMCTEVMCLFEFLLYSFIWFIWRLENEQQTLLNHRLWKSSFPHHSFRLSFYGVSLRCFVMSWFLVSFFPVVNFVVMRKLQKVIFCLPHVTMQMRMSFSQFCWKRYFYVLFLQNPVCKKRPQKNAQPKDFVVKKRKEIWK